MEIIWSVIVGGCLGAIGIVVLPQKGPEITAVTIVLGIIGAILATAIGSALRLFDDGDARAAVIASTAGAISLLAVYIAMCRRANVS